MVRHIEQSLPEDMRVYSGRIHTVLTALERLSPKLHEHPYHSQLSSCELSEDDIQAFLQAELVEEVDSESISGLSFDVRLFTVPEKGDTRRRGITHTPLSNTLLEEEISQITCSLPTPALGGPGVNKKLGATLDLKSCYHQFLLPKHLRIWHFRHGGRVFTLRTIPTGACWCPVVAHAVTEAMAMAVSSRFAGMISHAYIDNVRFLSDSREDLEAAVLMFFRLCEHYRFDINESMEDVLRETSVYDFLGVRYCHACHRTALTAKARCKLQCIATFQPTT
jgi:hypothetical protein